MGLPGVSDGRESACNAGGLGSIPGLGRSPGGEHGNPLQYSCLENLHGQRSLVGYSPGGCKELDSTERLSTSTNTRKHTHTFRQPVSTTVTSIPGTLSFDTIVEEKGGVLVQMPFFSMTAVSDDGISFSVGGFLHLDLVHSWGKYVCSFTRRPTRLLEQGIQHRATSQEPLARA